ncbi:MAG: hypothetical protein IPJ30_13800 [Acidobacteria bacterium]|nr:hypothetical protein [Acidobacteriota bacterium]
MFDLLRESDVQIYAIGFVNDLSKEGGFISKSPQAKAKAFMERLASETGGKVYFPNSLTELNGIAADIASELRTQYLISYSPTNTDKDGTFRTIRSASPTGRTRKSVSLKRDPAAKRSPTAMLRPCRRNPDRPASELAPDSGWNWNRGFLPALPTNTRLFRSQRG